MQYKYCPNNNFEDLASGRVIYGNSGVPNFPVRLLNEIFGRCLKYSHKKNHLNIYDPCCGGGYSLTVLGFCHQDIVDTVIGSDIDMNMVKQAEKNTYLLTKDGLNKRIDELKDMYTEYNKQSHYDAIQSSKNFKEKMSKDINSYVYKADCTKPLPKKGDIDIIITDVPYGNLVSWHGDDNDYLSSMLLQLSLISNKSTVLAVSMDKAQKVHSDLWMRVEKQTIGKRKFEIYVLK